MYLAKQQGKTKLLQHLQKLLLKCDNDEFLPVELSPPRDGVNVPAAPRRILCRSRKQYSSTKVIDIGQATQQIFVKPWSGPSMSVQVNTAEMTVDMLIKSVCKKFNISSAIEAYAVLEGSALDGGAHLCNYAVVTDSTIHIRLRARGGQPMTFDAKFNLDEGALFDEVELPEILWRAPFPQLTYVKFFSYPVTRYLHDLLKYVTGRHRVGWSFNGDFASTDIVWVGEREVNIARPEVPFTGLSCKADYARLHEIFVSKFQEFGYPCHFNNLLTYLATCPASEQSNNECVIAFVTNHPCLQPYEDRMKQMTVLANTIDRLSPADLQALETALGVPSTSNTNDWFGNYVCGVPEMQDRYYFGHIVTASGHSKMNNKYWETPKGCIYFCNNYLKHAHLQVAMKVVEAAYSFYFEEFIGELFMNMACRLSHVEWVTTLIRNGLAA